MESASARALAAKSTKIARYWRRRKRLRLFAAKGDAHPGESEIILFVDKESHTLPLARAHPHPQDVLMMMILV